VFPRNPAGQAYCPVKNQNENMNFKAFINIMPLKELLDPQGKAVAASMKNLELSELTNIRIGKHITLHVEATDKSEAQQKVTLACEKLLVNQIMESFELTIERVDETQTA
jgi:phosphoribosylformylglycinamidine synthase